MLELIIFVIIIVVILNKSKEKQAQNSSRRTPSAEVPPAPKKTPPSRTEERTFVQPSKPYRPAYNAAERHEEWMPVPDGKEVCRCGYCGADNLIPRNSDPGRYTCYFCRQEL